MHTLWQTLTLSQISFGAWRESSYLYHLVGLVAPWRRGSWLLQWAEPLGAFLICVLLLFAPFTSTGFLGLLLVACGAFWALITLSDRPEMLSSTPLHLILGLYWLVNVLATAFSPVPRAALTGLIKLTLYLLFFALGARVLRSPAVLNWVISTLLLLSLVVSGYGIRQERFGAEQLATWNDPTSIFAEDTRVYSYLGNPNLLGGYLLPVIGLGLAAFLIWHSWPRKALAATVVLSNTACLYYTDSRGAWIGSVVLFGSFALMLYGCYRDRLSPFWRAYLIPLVGGLVGGAIVLAFIQVESLRARVLSIFAWRGDSSNNFRINVWWAVLDMIGDRPWLGIGPGNAAFNKIYPLYMKPQYSALSSYSIFLETLVEVGFVGFLTLIWLLAVAFNRGWQQIQQWRQWGNSRGFWIMGAIAAMGGTLAQGLFDTVWYRPQINTLWWLLLAIIASQIPPRSPAAVAQSPTP